MDIVRFKGGLGNQMFQYALIEALRSKGRNVGSSLGYYSKNPGTRPFVLNKIFKKIYLNEVDENVFVEIDERWKKIKEDPHSLQNFKLNVKQRFFYIEEAFGLYEDDIFQTENCVFVGYWQTEKYFINIRTKILDCFSFNIHDRRLRDLGKQIKYNYIGVHVRRGDFLSVEMHNVCSLEYYFDAIKYMNNIYPNNKFIFFSDDIDWVEKNFRMENMLVCKKELFDSYQDWYDMYLMTLCKGIIISNSTFSWWGAWLNLTPNKVVIAPRIWLNGEDGHNIWCDDWIKL